MRISVFYDHIREACEQTGLELEEVLKRAKDFGISALEYSLESLEADPEKNKRMFDKCNMAVSSIYARYAFEAEDEPEKAFSLIDAARLFGAEKVLIIPGFTKIDENDPAKAVKTTGTEDMKKIAKKLKVVVEYANKNGITVTMEDFDDAHAPFASDDQLLWFANEVPGLRICFDTGNFMYAGVDELEAFDKLEKYISHVHCKDRRFSGFENEEPLVSIDGKRLYAVPVGYGEIHMKEIIKRLLKNGYDDTLAIEHFGAFDQLGFMEQSAKWIRSIVK